MKRWSIPCEIVVEAETAEEAIDSAATSLSWLAEAEYEFDPGEPRIILGCWPDPSEVKEDTDELGPHTTT